MNDNDTKGMIAFFALIGILLLAMFGYFAVDSLARSGDAQACIQAGKEWIHVRGSIYECRAP